MATIHYLVMNRELDVSVLDSSLELFAGHAFLLLVKPPDQQMFSLGSLDS